MSRYVLSVFALLILVGCRNAESPREEPKVDPRQRLLERIGNVNDLSRPRPLVTLEEFFDGNTGPGSIGYNLPDPPEPKEFYDLLRRVRDRAEVEDVRIAVMDLEDPDGWPATDTIWIITSASPVHALQVRIVASQISLSANLVDAVFQSLGK